MTSRPARARSEKIAFLVPVRNGGALLEQTLSSAARAGLPPDAYEFIVSDNASDDGSADRLPTTDPQGAPITLRRNPSDLGRVENWNRAIEAAQEAGFSYAMFLMVGDTLKDASVIRLRDRMSAAGAALGMASYEIVDEQSRPVRLARRITWVGGRAVLPKRFLGQSFGRGAMLFGPLGANLFHLDGALRPKFDARDASHTDQLATARFAVRSRRPIVYLDRPVSCWRDRPARFHNTMTLEDRFRDDVRVIGDACRDAGVDPDFPKIRATMILRGAFHRNGIWPTRRLAGRAAGDGAVSWSWLACLLQRQIRYDTPWLIEP